MDTIYAKLLAVKQILNTLTIIAGKELRKDTHKHRSTHACRWPVSTPGLSASSSPDIGRVVGQSVSTGCSCGWKRKFACLLIQFHVLICSILKNLDNKGNLSLLSLHPFSSSCVFLPFASISHHWNNVWGRQLSFGSGPPYRTFPTVCICIFRLNFLCMFMDILWWLHELTVLILVCLSVRTYSFSYRIQNFTFY